MMDFAELKKFFIFNLIGSLIICSLVAVVTVLIGDFNEITSRVLWTLFLVMVHSFVSLGFIWNDEKENTFEEFKIFSNISFLIIVLSFLTSIFGIWGILEGDLVWRLYLTYLIIGFASLHGDILSKALNKEEYIDLTIYLNYVFMLVVVLMLLPVIYIDNATKALSEIYFRFLAAAGIIDGTLGVLTMIFYKLYMHKHPKMESVNNPIDGSLIPFTGDKKEKKASPWLLILIGYLVFLIFSFFISVIGFF